jgi:hypothetical protein
MRSSKWAMLSAALLGATAAFGGCRVKHDDKGTGGTSVVAATTAPSVASVGSVSSTGSGMMGGKLGKQCTKDGDCDAGGRCVTPADDDPVFGGGAVGGYCTKDCLGDDECEKLGAGSACIFPQGANKGECLLGCTIGPALMYLDDELSQTKCHGREDAMCYPLPGNVTACVPVCGTDAQCGGRKCDPLTGSCVDKPHTGKPNGALCNDAASTNECAGFCQKFTGAPSICTSPCTLGGELAQTDDCGGINKGLCTYKPGGYGAGDFGRCAAACDKHDICGHPAWWCQHNDATMQAYCFTTVDCKTTADCVTAKYTAPYDCVQTKYGGKCLEREPKCVTDCGMDPACIAKCPPRHPLGAAAPPMMGTGGGGGAGGGM